MEKKAYLEYNDVIGQVSRMYFIIFLVKNHFLQNEKQQQQNINLNQ